MSRTRGDRLVERYPAWMWKGHAKACFGPLPAKLRTYWSRRVRQFWRAEVRRDPDRMMMVPDNRFGNTQEYY